MDDEIKKRICDALRVIRMVCEETENCHQCPLYNEENDICVIQCKDPCNWILTDERTIWRAFDLR